MYWGQKENKEAGERIRERYSKPNETSSTLQDTATPLPSKQSKGILKNS